MNSIQGRTMSGLACHHRLWTAHTVGRCVSFHAIISLGQHTRSDKVNSNMPSLTLDNTHGRITLAVQTLSPLDNTHSQMTSRMASHHHPWTSHTITQRGAWNAIIHLGQHTRSEYVRRGILSPPYVNTHSRMTSSVGSLHGSRATHTVA